MNIFIIVPYSYNDRCTSYEGMKKIAKACMENIFGFK